MTPGPVERPDAHPADNPDSSDPEMSHDEVQPEDVPVGDPASVAPAGGVEPARVRPGRSLWEEMLNKWALRWLIAAGCLVLLAVAAVPVVNTLYYTPGRAALAYMSALEDADAARAMGFVSAPTPDQGQALSTEVVSNAPSLPADARLVSTHTEGSHATVSVAYVLRGSERRMELSMDKLPPGSGLFARWVIDMEAWPTLDLDVRGTSRAELNGVSVPTDVGALPVFFPLSYNVGFSAEYFSADTAQVDVLSPDSAESVSLQPQPTEALSTEVETQVHEELDACTRQTVLMPTGCPFGFDMTDDIIGDVSWKVVSYPKVDLVSVDRSLTMAPADGVFEVSGRYRDMVTAVETDFTEQVSAPVTAEVSVQGDEVRVDLTGAGPDLESS